MTIGKYGGDGTDEFIVLAGIKTEIIKQMKTKNLPEVKIELSMGMSADYEDAVLFLACNPIFIHFRFDTAPLIFGLDRRFLGPGINK